jgi:hypothetical protein
MQTHILLFVNGVDSAARVSGFLPKRRKASSITTWGLAFGAGGSKARVSAGQIRQLRRSSSDRIAETSLKSGPN